MQITIKLLRYINYKEKGVYGGPFTIETTTLCATAPGSSKNKLKNKIKGGAVGSDNNDAHSSIPPYIA